jgi:hypothetical protein
MAVMVVVTVLSPRYSDGLYMAADTPGINKKA